MKRVNEQSVKQAIDEMIDSFGIRDKYNENTLLNSYPGLVGKTIANHTTNLFIKDKKLFIYLDSAVIKNELHYSREKLMQLLNEPFPKPIIQEIIVR